MLAAVTEDVTLGDPERTLDAYLQHVRGARALGEVIYFASILTYDKKSIPLFRVQHVYDGKWEVIGEGLNYKESRQLVFEHFQNSYGLLNAEEEPV